MKSKSVKIGNIETKNNVFLAPMAGYTDFAMRGICSTFGAGLTVTEMVSAKGLIYKNKGTKDLLKISPDENLTAVQLFGNDPEIMKEACLSEELKDFKIVDINMGCPAPKIFSNKEGSALLGDMRLAERIISACSKTDKIITVKTRIGLSKEKYLAEEFSKMAENAGAKMITLHGRVKTDYFSGEINYSEIEKAKKAVQIPVIANGGIKTKEDATTLLEKTGADGVMIGQTALSKPYIFSEILGIPYSYDIKATIIKHITELKNAFGDQYATINMRKILPCYFKGSSIPKEEKNKFNYSKNTNEMITLLEKIFNN